jgi:hypothetical protein
MNRVTRCLLFGSALAALLGARARADDPKNAPLQPDRPGIADGSTVVGPGAFQVEAGVQGQDTRDRHGSDHALFTPLLLRYGLSRQWEARFETNGFSHDWASSVAGVSRASGFAPVSIGAKYHFQDAPEGSRKPSLGTIVRVFPASGSDGFRSRHVTGDWRLSADTDLGHRLSLNPNLGAALYEDGTGRTFGAALAAATLTYAVGKRVQVFVDSGAQAPEVRAGHSAVLFDGGAMYLVNRDTQLDVAAGRGIRGRTSPDVFWTAGISRRF